MNDRASTETVERETLAAIGWSAKHGTTADPPDPELFAHAARRRIAEVLADQIERHGSTSWAAVQAALHDPSDPNVHEVMAELVEVVTADGWPAALPALLEYLTAAADRRARWQAAIEELSELAGRPVKVVAAS